MRYCGDGMGHQAVREAMNLFLKDRPREELDIRRDEAQDKSEAGKEGEGKEEQAEPPLGATPSNLEDIPGGDKVIDDEDKDEDEDEDGEDTQSDSDEEEEEDEGDEVGEVDDTSKYTEL